MLYVYGIQIKHNIDDCITFVSLACLVNVFNIFMHFGERNITLQFLFLIKKKIVVSAQNIIRSII